MKKWFSEQEHHCSEIINKIVHKESEYLGNMANVHVYSAVRVVHYAAYYGNVDIVEYFLENGAGMVI